MAKNKYQLSQIHKIKVHHNRWLIWTIAYLFFIFIAVLGFIQVSTINFDTEELMAESSFEPWHHYKNNELMFSLRYPSGWSIEPASQTSVDFMPVELARPGVNVSVYGAGDERKVRAVLDIQSEKELEVGGVMGTEIVNQLDSSGTTETIVLIENEGRLYSIRGTAGSVRAFLQTFTFIK